MILVPVLVFLLFAPVAIFLQRLYRFRNRTIHEVTPFLRRINIEELESLLDSRGEYALQQNLTAALFAKAQLRRIHLFREKLKCADHNASVLQQWAVYELDRTYVTHDDQVRTNAACLLELCREFRIAAFWIQIQLNLWYVKLALLPVRRIPFLSCLRTIDSFDLLDCYRQLAEKAAALSSVTSGESCRLNCADLL
ncbi:MAG TPA: hypothetical protein VFW31_09870 [Candidatus Angelobacter sp.]|nr:hypothetical protein [Candidatus Angelobacter sp.]